MGQKPFPLSRRERQADGRGLEERLAVLKVEGVFEVVLTNRLWRLFKDDKGISLLRKLEISDVTCLGLELW